MRTDVSDLPGEHRALAGICDSASAALRIPNASAAQNQTWKFILTTTGRKRCRSAPLPTPCQRRELRHVWLGRRGDTTWSGATVADSDHCPLDLTAELLLKLESVTAQHMVT